MIKYITSDLHLGHEKVLEYCNRPYDTVENMNEDFINKINKLPDGSHLYHLGDFVIGGKKKILEFLSRIKKNIKMIFILGNHDSMKPTIVQEDKRILWVGYYKKEKVLGGDVYLFHYPILEWPSKHYGTIHFHGHSHGNSTYPYLPARIRDVGIDCTNYEIRSLEDHVKEMLEIPFGKERL